MGDINSQRNKILIYRLLNFQQSISRKGKIRISIKKTATTLFFYQDFPIVLF